MRSISSAFRRSSSSSDSDPTISSDKPSSESYVATGSAVGRQSGSTSQVLDGLPIQELGVLFGRYSCVAKELERVEHH